MLKSRHTEYGEAGNGGSRKHFDCFGGSCNTASERCSINFILSIKAILHDCFHLYDCQFQMFFCFITLDHFNFWQKLFPLVLWLNCLNFRPFFSRENHESSEIIFIIQERTINNLKLSLIFINLPFELNFSRWSFASWKKGRILLSAEKNPITYPYWYDLMNIQIKEWHDKDWKTRQPMIWLRNDWLSMFS